MSYVEAIEYQSPMQIQAHRERMERLRRLGARAVPDRGISIQRPTFGVDGPMAKALREKERKERAKHLAEPPEKSLEDRLAEIRSTLIVTYQNDTRAAAVEKKGIPIREVQSVFCAVSGVRRLDLLSHRRTPDIVVPRQLCMMLCKALTLESLPSIGRHFAGRDHTTVLHALRKMKPVEDAVRAKLPADATLLQWVNEALAVYREFPKGELKGRNRRSHD
jgi:hypothetical protein